MTPAPGSSSGSDSCPDPARRPLGPTHATGPRALRRRRACPPAGAADSSAREHLVVELRSALAGAWIADDPLPLEHLGAGPVRCRDDVLARIDALARALLARMDDEAWDPGAAPRAVTSVLAASVPAAEALLLRAAAGHDGRAREAW
jgi:hypothetical protein